MNRADFSAVEGRICLRLNRLNLRPASARFFALVSRLGDGWIWHALLLAFALTNGLAGLALACLTAAGGLTCTTVYRAIKGGTRRPRPLEVHRTLALTVAPLDRFSFPSGHTLHAVYFTAVAITAVPALAIVLVPFTAAVALSRLVLGLHWPTDVLAGASIGLGIALPVIALGSGLGLLP